MRVNYGPVAVLVVCLIGTLDVEAWAQTAAPPGSTGSLFGYTGPPPSLGLSPPPTRVPRTQPFIAPYAQLSLNSGQRQAIARIQHDTQQQNQRLLGQIREQQGQLQQLYATDMPDPNKIGEVYDRMSTLHRQLIQNDIAAHNEILALLSEDQRRQLTLGQGTPGLGGSGSFP